jgi:hypothetical protein
MMSMMNWKMAFKGLVLYTTGSFQGLVLNLRPSSDVTENGI